MIDYEVIGKRVMPTPQWDAVHIGDEVGVNFFYHPPQESIDVKRAYIHLALGEANPIYLKKPVDLTERQGVEIPMRVVSKDKNSIRAAFDDSFAAELNKLEIYVEATNITEILNGE